ncbi:POTRA domain-containing protein [Selenomonas sp. TAMA-11512]|uniref:BamA/OMP85 family outer membrane protein n=1 Tax=Selenomonas sp. TAMA-11512 TaxID=3095337 RepID=UPI00308BFAD3|nr:POTRA domain-containing protein [Selenomonas sp. TAMA-11512]
MKRKQVLTCALALVTGFSAYASEASAETTRDVIENAQEMKNSAADAAEVARVEANVKLDNVESVSNIDDEAMRKWQESRPKEEDVASRSGALAGRTIVALNIEGASEAQKADALAAITSRVGDAYSVETGDADRAAIFDTGWFYDIYPTWEEVPEGVRLTYHVLENPVLKSIELQGNTVESTEKLLDLMTVKTGTILNSRELQSSVARLQEEYRKDGYILAKISDMNIDQTGELKIWINEGVLEGYAVNGNKKTKDRVIIREMRMKPGDPFDVKKARRSMQRVYNLGFFEDVNMKLNPGSTDGAVILETDVVEKRTGNFGVGAGYSTDDGFLGMVNIGDTNFRGTGDAISASYEFGGDADDAHGFSFSYRRPWLDSKETTGILRVYNRTYKYSDYDVKGNLKEKYMRKYSGGEVTLGRPISEYSTNFITLRSRKDEYKRHTNDGNMGDRSKTEAGRQWIKDNFGQTNSVILQHVTDTRDNIYYPSSGNRTSLEVEAAGLGGDFDYRKYTIEDSHFFKAGKSQVWAFRAQYGFGDGKIPETNEYRIGGQDSLRGYRDDQFRGDHMYLFTAEYRFPLFKKVQAAIFTDWGAAWDSGFAPENSKGSVGLGVQLETPVGPIRLDYGRGDDGGRVHFSIGGAF